MQGFLRVSSRVQTSHAPECGKEGKGACNRTYQGLYPWRSVELPSKSESILGFLELENGVYSDIGSSQ